MKRLPKRIFWPASLLTITGALAATTLPLPPVPIPSHNPQTPAKIELGRQLFYDPNLSRERDVSCASCHEQDKAFSTNDAVSPGTAGRLGKRSPPSLVNVAYRPKLFWHGGSQSLELQALGPLTDHNEMDLTVEEIVARLKADPQYVTQFMAVFGQPPSVDLTLKAIAAFERTLVSFNSPFDRFSAGEKTAINESAQRGLDLFYGKAECFHCHTGRHFSDNRPHNNASELFNEDIGYAQVTGEDADVGKFITPTLRNVALTAPYMHAGQLKTLREVVQHYNEGGQPNPNADALMRPLGLTDQEVTDLVAFLNTLTDDTIATNPAFSPKGNMIK